MSTDQIPMPAEDELLLEVSALRAEVAVLRPIAAAAEYLYAAEAENAGCIEDRDCDEYTSDTVDLCSHVDRRYATYAHVQAHGQLAYLVRDLRRLLLDMPGTEEVLTLLREGLCAVVANLQGDVDAGADEVADHPVYVTAAAESDDEYRQQLAARDRENDRG